MIKEKILLQMKYKKNGNKINHEILNGMEKAMVNDGYKIIDGCILEDGKVERGGVEMEYLTTRILMVPIKPEPPQSTQEK